MKSRPRSDFFAEAFLVVVATDWVASSVVFFFGVLKADLISKASTIGAGFFTTVLSGKEDVVCLFGAAFFVAFFLVELAFLVAFSLFAISASDLLAVFFVVDLAGVLAADFFVVVVFVKVFEAVSFFEVVFLAGAFLDADLAVALEVVFFAGALVAAVFLTDFTEFFAVDFLAGFLVPADLFDAFAMKYLSASKPN